MGLFSGTHYKVRIKGGNEDEFSCFGQALGLDVSLSAKSVQFGEVTLGKTTSRVIYVHNASSQSATFQFVNDQKNVFSFSKREGMIKPRSDFRIVITFCPTETINFYERVFCVVKNHLVLFVDLVGTCYDLLHRPYPLYQRHVNMYRHRVIMGTYKGGSTEPAKETRRSPIKNMASSTMQQQSMMEGGVKSEEEVQIDDPNYVANEEIPMDAPNYVATHKEMFWECNAASRGVYFKEDMLDFGFSVSGIKSDPKEVTLVNTLNYDITAYWVIPSLPTSSTKV